MKYIIPLINSLNELTFDELLIEFDNFNLKKIPAYPIVKGLTIYRARPIEDNEFNLVKDFLYRPIPEKFDRASTPCSPMFYGSISTNSEDVPIITCIAELNQNIRNKIFNSDKQEIAIAEFEVIEDFNSAAIIFCEDFLQHNKQYLNLYNEYKSYSKQDFEILKEISNLFSSSDDKNKILTSAFSQFILNKYNHIDAIMYPSVRLNGEGTCIAIHPVTAKLKLACKKVSVAKIYLEDEFVVCDYVKETDLITDNSSFTLTGICEKKIIGENESLKILKDEIEFNRILKQKRQV